MRFLLEENDRNLTLYTVQDKSVLELLKKNKTYIASYDNIFDSTYKALYKRLAELVGFKNCPIFCATKYSMGIIDSSNIKGNHKVLLKLSVPKTETKSHQYYDWADYLYYNNDFSNATITKKELESLLKSQDIYDKETEEVIIDKIKPEWLVQ